MAAGFALGARLTTVDFDSDSGAARWAGVRASTVVEFLALGAVAR